MMSILFTLLFASQSQAVTFQGDPNIEYNEYDFNGLEQLNLTNTHGQITISPMPATKATIKIFKKDFNDKCAATIQRAQFETLTVAVTAPEGEKCGADIVLQLPPMMNLSLKQTEGDIVINGIHGKLDYVLARGNVSANGTFTTVDGKTQDGRVDITGVGGGGDVRVTNGSVRLKFLNDVQGAMNVRTQVGDTTLLFPAGSKVKASVDGGANLKNELGESGAADYNLKVNGTVGRVQIQSF